MGMLLVLLSERGHAVQSPLPTRWGCPSLETHRPGQPLRVPSPLQVLENTKSLKNGVWGVEEWGACHTCP